MKKITDRLSITGQLTPDAIAGVATQGFAAIVNNRPDGEEAGQPTAAAGRAAAEAAGLAYTHIPVVPGQISAAQVRAFQQAVDAAGGPVVAHCKTGTRAAMLHVIGEVLDGRMQAADIPALGQRLGLDLSGALRWLQANGH